MARYSMQVSEQYLSQFDPFRGPGEWVTEEPEAYAERMQNTLLPRWPTEVLIEWFHRHAQHLYDYAFLGFERFQFSKQEWKISEIPGREAFASPKFCDSFMDIERRAENPNDWLAQYMQKNGTWNTPIILLTVTKEIIAPSRLPLNRPWHLLEGHRRLSFLTGLKKLGKAKQTHCVWWLIWTPPRKTKTTSKEWRVTGTWITTVGLVFDIAGAWLVAVEVIRSFKPEYDPVIEELCRDKNGRTVMHDIGATGHNFRLFLAHAKKNRGLMWVGLGLLTVGFTLQGIGAWWPEPW